MVLFKIAFTVFAPPHIKVIFKCSLSKCFLVVLFRSLDFSFLFFFFFFPFTGEAAKRKTLDWATRLSIALGAARGKYLCISQLYIIFFLP